MREKFRVREIEPNVLEIQLSASSRLNIYKDPMSSRQMESILASLGRMYKDFNIEKAVCFVEFPGWQPLVEKFRESNGAKLVFDCLDEYSGFSNVGDRIARAEKALIDNSDLMITTLGSPFQEIR